MFAKGSSGLSSVVNKANGWIWRSCRGSCRGIKKEEETETNEGPLVKQEGKYQGQALKACPRPAKPAKSAEPKGYVPKVLYLKQID